VALASRLWPRVRLAGYQQDILYSLWDTPETVITAGNELGKDFVVALGIWLFAVTRHPWRVIVTSANERHLKVLWGELGKLKNSCAEPLDHRDGGPFKMDSEKIVRVVGGRTCPVSYVMQMVAGPDSLDAMAGHHVPEVGPGAGFDCCGEYLDWAMPRTLFVGDEASSINDEYVTRSSGWRKRMLLFGNPWTCDNYFRQAVEGRPGTDDPGGDMVRDTARNREWVRLYGSPSSRSPTSSAANPGASSATPSAPPLPDGYVRRVFTLGAEDSPNVRFARKEQAAGLEPSGRMIVAGLKSWDKYQLDLRTMDKYRQTVQLHGKFYKGAEQMLFPPDWLSHSEQLAFDLFGGAEGKARKRMAKGMGVDPAEGGDDASWCVVDELGVLDLVNYKTPDTDVIPRQTLALIRKWNLDPGAVVFDRGGGGKQHADRLRAAGHPVRSLGFGAPKKAEAVYGKVFPDARFGDQELSDAYTSRRTEMYDRLSCRMNPSGAYGGFAIAREYGELRRQLGPVPRIYDKDGKLYLPPKQRKPGQKMLTEKTLVELIGCSPDEADSLVLAVWAMENPAHVINVG
jgi:hypothetical protein